MYSELISYFCVGGEPGEKGENLMIYKDGRTVNLGGKTSVDCHAGVRILSSALFYSKESQIE